MSRTDQELSVYSVNLRRIMAQAGLTLAEVVSATGTCERTVKGILSGRTKPHARTLNRIATGLGVSTDEFFAAITVEAERRAKRDAQDDIHAKVDELLANGQRKLLTEFVDLLWRQTHDGGTDSTVYATTPSVNSCE